MAVWSTDGFWALAYPGCLVAEGDYWGSAIVIMQEHGPGAYLVDFQWEDGDLWLTAVTEDGSSMPIPARALDSRWASTNDDDAGGQASVWAGSGIGPGEHSYGLESAFASVPGARPGAAQPSGRTDDP